MNGLMAVRVIGRPQVLHAMLQRAVAQTKAARRQPAPQPRQDDSRYMPKS